MRFRSPGPPRSGAVAGIAGAGSTGAEVVAAADVIVVTLDRIALTRSCGSCHLAREH